MINYPSASQATPLIIVGPQRSGTRFVTNVLNAVPGVTLQGEIADSIIRYLMKVATQGDRLYAQSERTKRGEYWEKTRRDFMFAAWGNLSKENRVEPDPSCFFYGYKTPYHEVYFDFYNTFFAPVRPQYVCCVRSFLGHYFSVHARWPKRSILRIALRYVYSLRQLRYMKKTRPEDVLFFFLDDYKKLGFHYLQERLFAPLGLQDTAAAKRIAAQGPMNSSAQLGLRKEDTLRPRQKLILSLYPQAEREYRALHREFGGTLQ